MLPKVVRSRPFLVFGAAVRYSAVVVYVLGDDFGMADSHVSVNIILSAKSLDAGTSGDVTMVSLRMFLLMFSSCALVKLQPPAQNGEITYLNSDLVLTVTLQYGQTSCLASIVAETSLWVYRLQASGEEVITSK